jgi:HK97 family phage major capsid protein
MNKIIHYRNNPLFIKKSITHHQLVTKNYGESPSSPLVDYLKEFLMEGSITQKSYDCPQIKENTIVLPNELTQHFISQIKDLSLLNYVKTIKTDANSIVIPIRKSQNNCLWHQYGQSPNHENHDTFENKLINLSTVSTCPMVTRDFLFKNENFTPWLMAMIQNDIYYEVMASMFNEKEDPRSPSVESFFSIPKKYTFIANSEIVSISQGLQQLINGLDGNYRKNTRLLVSRKFFNHLWTHLLKLNNPFGNFILNGDKILGYPYEIVDLLEGTCCILGDFEGAYTLIIKNDSHLERDSVTKKNLIQFFYTHSFGGSLVNPQALRIMFINEE